MERINFQVIEKKWQKHFAKNLLYRKEKKAKKFYCLEMFPYLLEKFTWDMLEIIQSEMLLLGSNI